MPYRLEFFKLFFKIQRHLLKQLPGQNPHQMTAVELMIIHFIKQSGIIKPSELSQYLGIPGSTLTGILDRMENKNLIERNRDQNDRRVVLISFSQQFKNSGIKLEDTAQKYFETISLDLPPEWWVHMTEELQKLEQLISESEEKNNGTSQ